MNQTVEINEEKIKNVLDDLISVNWKEHRVFDKCGAIDINAEMPFLKELLFSDVSIPLLEKYAYLNSAGAVRLTYFVDLLIQSRDIVKNGINYTSSHHGHFTGTVLTPTGESKEVHICSNLQGKLSIKLPTEAAIK